MASVTAGGPLGRAGEPASAGASRTSRDFKPGGARAGPAATRPATDHSKRTQPCFMCLPVLSPCFGTILASWERAQVVEGFCLPSQLPAVSTLREPCPGGQNQAVSSGSSLSTRLGLSRWLGPEPSACCLHCLFSFSLSSVTFSS